MIILISRQRLFDQCFTNTLLNESRTLLLKQQNLQSFVPDYYLSSAHNCADPSKGYEMQKALEIELSRDPSRTDLKEKLDHLRKGQRSYRGDFPEFNLYLALKDYHAEKQSIVTVFHALDIFDLDFERSMDKIHLREKDLVIVDPIHRCVIYIECKATIGAEKTLQKVCEQVDGMKNSLESWFGVDLFGSDWHYVPLVFHENIMEDYKACKTCSTFIIHGKNINKLLCVS